MILSGLAGIIPVNVTQGNGSQNQKVQPAAGSDEILSFFETGLPTYGGSTQFPWSVNVVNTTLGVNTTASTSASILNFTLPL